MVKKFKDLPIGYIFEAYGDEISNYDYPKDCIFVKTEEGVATEIDDNGKLGQHNLVEDSYEVWVNTG